MARHPNYRHQREAVDWARGVFERRGQYVILDTETTGLTEKDEIIQMAIVDLYGKELFNQNFKPSSDRKRISAKASSIHGLTMKVLKDCPRFYQAADALAAAIGNRTIITYNADFDRRLYQQTRKLAGGYMPAGRWECAMLKYAQFVGEWNTRHGNYRWHALMGGDHTALGDCMATLRLIKSMADSPRLRRFYQFWLSTR